MKNVETIEIGQKYERFNQWCKQEGVIMPKLEYPAEFEGGLVGTKCLADIEHREAYLHVPYKMLLSVKSTVEHPVLGQILEEHPECFAEEICDDFEQLTLVLRLIYEISLGRESYWYPYLMSLPDV